MAGVALHHLVGWLEAGVGDLSHGQLLVVGLLGGDDGGVGGQGEVDTGVGHQVGLELSQIHVQGAVEAEGGGDGGDDLADQTVEVGVGGALNVQVAAADVVDGLVVDHEGAVGVLQGGVGGQDGVVGLHDGGGHLQHHVSLVTPLAHTKEIGGNKDIVSLSTEMSRYSHPSHSHQGDRWK